MPRLALAAALLCASLTAQPLHAAEAAQAGISVKAAWLRATPNAATVAGGYVTIVNAGATPDQLIAASIPQAARGEVHTMSMESGVMQMARLDDGLAVPPGATVTLKPGGDHLMFFNPTAPLKEGDSIAGTLTFAKAGAIAVIFTVAGMAAKAAPDAAAPMSGMPSPARP